MVRYYFPETRGTIVVNQCLDYQFDGEWIILSAYEKVKVDKEQENNTQKDKYYRSL